MKATNILDNLHGSWLTETENMVSSLNVGQISELKSEGIKSLHRSHGYKLNFWTIHERISLMSQTYQVRVDKTLVYPKTIHSGKWKVIRGVVLEINSVTVLFGWYATTGIHRRYDIFIKLKHSETKLDQNC